MKHPMQKIENGRFVANPIVEYLLDNGGIDLNHLARRGFSKEDHEHFAQLIGYSVSGYADLSYVSAESYETAEKMEAFGDYRDARINALEEMLEAIRKPLRDAACEAFAVHPDDLQSTPN